MSHKFDNVSKDKDTTIYTSVEASFGEYCVLYQTWGWGTIKAESLIFSTDDINHLTEDELIEEVRQSPLIKEECRKKEITYKQLEEFTFVNFNFNDHDAGYDDFDDVFDASELAEIKRIQKLHFTNFDIIGDIHGHSTELVKLLTKLKYELNEQGFYSHKYGRKAIFVGDFIDRGPEQKAVIDIVKGMVENDTALAVMGNHEFNAISYNTLHPTTGKPLRSHSSNHKKQHQAFLDEYTDEEERKETIDWFKTLPLFLDLHKIRIIHACWNDCAIASIKNKLDSNNCLNDEFLIAANEKDSIEFNAIETLLKGIELKLPAGCFFKDSYGQERYDIRIKWWAVKDFSYSGLAIVTENLKDKIPNNIASIDHLDDFQYQEDAKPVFFGHYWFTGQPSRLQKNVACLDYSVANKGHLTAYSWCQQDVVIRDRFFVQAK